ncbi:MAG: TonB-dependent receptor [Ignavibacteria bacterium]|nr:TonB-dependent receptor [Ignavibacteria bacterium]
MFIIQFQTLFFSSDKFRAYVSFVKTFLISLILLCVNNEFLFSQDEADTSEYKTESIEVDALKGKERSTPVTFQDIKRSEIENKYWMQDLPMFLNGNTSINSYSESGASLGYSYMSLRGFDQKRISILINGIPQNDPEDHQVYWVDVSDLTASAEEMQIQRGIGTALYGSSAIGGVINVRTIDYFKRKFLNFSGGYGNYNSKRFSAEYSSGLFKNGFGLYAKIGKINTDGYRDLSWSDNWSYFISAGLITGKKSVIKMNFFGSPMKNHLAYTGVDKAYLDGEVTGDKLKDRKYNYLTYPDETDNYFQPHYELVYNFQPGKNLLLSNTFSYIRGDGYFNTSYPVFYGYDFDYFRMKPFFVQDTVSYNSLYYKRNDDGTFYFEKGKGYEIVRSDLVSRLNVNNNTYGWFPKVQLKHNNEKGTLIVGGEIRYHKSEHFGEVTSGESLPPGTPQDFVYYFYNGGKRTYSAYVNELYRITEKLDAMIGLQYVYHRYNLSNDRFKPYDFSLNYNFFTPRTGINYNFNDKLNAFINFSIAKREPRLKDIYDAENPDSKPNFRIIDTLKGIYDDPLIKPEEMKDYEFGISYNSYKIKAELNFYFMDFKNEIVNNGQLDNVGQPISGNAGKSIHKGIELGFKISPFSQINFKGLTISGNLNLSDNYFTDYREVSGADSSGNIIYGNDYTDNKILLTPGVIGNLTLNYSDDHGINAYLSLQHIGKQYLDNSENERKNPEIRNQIGYVEKIIKSYTVFNAGLSLNILSLTKTGKSLKVLKNVKIDFKANNIFDALYETSGSISGGIPYWIPAATRNFYAELKIGF